MTEVGLAAEIRRAVPGLRGRLGAGQSLAELMWFRVGGPAEVLFQPADEDDLAALLAALDGTVPVTVIGLGSNLLVRDGGIRGVVIRLGRGFSETTVEAGYCIRTGTAVPDARLARIAAGRFPSPCHLGKHSAIGRGHLGKKLRPLIRREIGRVILVRAEHF